MDLTSLMESLSLKTPDEEPVANCHVFSVNIGQRKTDIVFGEFTNKFVIIATQYGRIGSLLRVTVDTANAGESVYNVHVLFGADNLEQQAAARHIAEVFAIQKPLLFFVCLQDYTTATVKALIDALLNVPNKDTNSL